jgi:hypothetical protein
MLARDFLFRGSALARLSCELQFFRRSRSAKKTVMLNWGNG